MGAGSALSFCEKTRFTPKYRIDDSKTTVFMLVVLFFMGEIIKHKIT
jgi:hypothetical protein